MLAEKTKKRVLDFHVWNFPKRAFNTNIIFRIALLELRYILKQLRRLLLQCPIKYFQYALPLYRQK